MKKMTLMQTMLITAVTVMAFCSCAGKNTKNTEDAPEIHSIAYDESMSTLNDEGGADVFDHSLDHADSRYYRIHDFYNMKSDETLHILPNFHSQPSHNLFLPSKLLYHD